jgi:UDP-glucose-4-epimerase GalE
MNVLVTGGAGYIGAHCCQELAARGFRPVVYDNLTTGHREHVRWGELVEGDINDAARLDEVCARYRIEAVMHFAGFIEVGESVADPLKYFGNNVAGSLQVLRAMVRHGIACIVFSSSAAVYGTPRQAPIDEDHPTHPLSPYGRTKLMVEHILADCETAYRLRWMALRYFNAAGADPAARIGEWHDPESHLIPRILDAAWEGGRPVQVYGTDYPTPDGSCIRDYIHVADLARAHVLALERLLAGDGSGAFNLGQGRGYSVMEVIRHAAQITGRQLPIQTAPRRGGDPPVLIASNRKAQDILSWAPEQSSLENIIASAWKWHCRMKEAAQGARRTAQGQAQNPTHSVHRVP